MIIKILTMAAILEKSTYATSFPSEYEPRLLHVDMPVKEDSRLVILKDWITCSNWLEWDGKRLEYFER